MKQVSGRKALLGLLALAVAIVGVVAWRVVVTVRGSGHEVVGERSAADLRAPGSAAVMPPLPTAAPELVAPTPPGVPPPGLPAWSQPVGPPVVPAPPTTTPPSLTEAERALLTGDCSLLPIGIGDREDRLTVPRPRWTFTSKTAPRLGAPQKKRAAGWWSRPPEGPRKTPRTRDGRRGAWRAAPCGNPDCRSCYSWWRARRSRRRFCSQRAWRRAGRPPCHPRSD